MRKILLFSIGTLLFAPIPRVEAREGGGAIVLSTTLLTVEAHQRTATVSLANRTADDQRYRVSVIDMVMGEDGQLALPDEESASATGHSASSWVVATPRSLHLRPGQSQTIRLLFRRPRPLADGEYRAHLRVAQEPPADSAGGLEETGSAEGMRVDIVTVYSMSIPIVLQQGKLEVDAAISDARRVEPDGLALTVDRRGNASFRGFARVRAGELATIDMPITIYRERDRVTRTYDLAELANTKGPLTLTLYEGTIPRPGRPVPAEALGTLTVVP